MSSRRSMILVAARRAGTAWEESGGTLTPELRSALADLRALTGTEECPEPESTLYLVLRQDWKTWVVQAASDAEARARYVEEVPHLGFRGIFRDTRTPLWFPDRDGDGS